jgi:hemolysin D
MPKLAHNPPSLISKDEQHLSPVSEADEWFYGTEELLDAVPKTWTRSLLYALLIFTAVILPWSVLSKMDETGSARGRIEPKGATQKLDIATTGTVTAVRVKEGDNVKAGQVLVELESDVLRTQLQEVQKKLEGQRNQVAQLNLLKNQLAIAIGIQQQQNKSQELEKISQVNQAQQYLDSKQSTFNLQKSENLAQVEQAHQNLNTSQTNHSLASSRLGRDTSEVERYSQLLASGSIPEIKVVELQKTAEDSQRLQFSAASEIKQAQLRIKEAQSHYQTIINQAKSDILQAKLRLGEQQSSYQSLIQSGKLAVIKNEEQLKDIQSQIANLQAEIGQTQSQIKSVSIQISQRMLFAPTDGTIFQLPIKRPGTVVQSGQMIAAISPSGSALILKAQMPNQQSGHLRVGMPVKVKFDAYPFQDYGVVQGRVSWIAPDSKTQETKQGIVETFDLDITLQQPDLKAGNKRIPITPGQTATAEVIIRQRRLIDYLLDPFTKLHKGGIPL